MDMGGLAAAAAAAALKKKQSTSPSEPDDETKDEDSSSPPSSNPLAAAAAAAALKKKSQRSNVSHGSPIIKNNDSDDTDVSYGTTLTFKTTATLSPKVMAGIAAAAASQATSKKKVSDNQFDPAVGAVALKRSISQNSDVSHDSILETKDSNDTDVSYGTSLTTKTPVLAGIAAAAAQAALHKNISTNINIDGGEKGSSIATPEPMDISGISAAAARAAMMRKTRFEYQDSSDANDASDLEIGTYSSADSILDDKFLTQNNVSHNGERGRPSNPMAAIMGSLDEDDDDSVVPLARPVAKYIEDNCDHFEAPQDLLVANVPSDECLIDGYGLEEVNSMDSELSYGDTVASLNTSSKKVPKNGRQTYNSTILRPKSGRKTFNSTVLRPLEIEDVDEEQSKGNDSDDGDVLAPLPSPDAHVTTRSQRKGKKRSNPNPSSPEGKKPNNDLTNKLDLITAESFDSQDSNESISTINTTNTLQTIQSFARKTDLAFQTLTERANFSSNIDDKNSDGSVFDETKSNDDEIIRNKMDSRNDEATQSNKKEATAQTIL